MNITVKILWLYHWSMMNSDTPTLYSSRIDGALLPFGIEDEL